MPDGIMDQIRAQQAHEQAARNLAARQEQSRITQETRDKFAREAPEIIAIMRQHGVAPQRIVMCDYVGGKTEYIGEVASKGWLINGTYTNFGYDPYPVTKHVALMEEGYCVPCMPPDASYVPPEAAGALAIWKENPQQHHWGAGVHVDAVQEVRRLLRE